MSKKPDSVPAAPAAEPAPLSAPVQGVKVSDLVAGMPEVNEAAIAADLADQAEATAAQPQATAPAGGKPAPISAPSPALPASKPAAASAPAATDEQGNVFNPLVHECTDDGRPIFRQGSTYLKRRRRPLKEWKTASTIGEPPVAPDPAAPAPDAAAPQAAAPTAEQFRLAQQATAQTAAGVQLLVMRRAFGETIASKKGEPDQLVDAWAAVLAHYNVGPVHPVFALIMVSGALVVANVNEPKTQSALARWRDWFERVALGLWQRIRRRFGFAKRDDAEKEGARPSAAAEPAPNADADVSPNGLRVVDAERE